VNSSCSAARRYSRTASALSCATPFQIHTLRRGGVVPQHDPARQRDDTAAPRRNEAPSDLLSLATICMCSHWTYIAVCENRLRPSRRHDTDQKREIDEHGKRHVNYCRSQCDFEQNRSGYGKKRDRRTQTSLLLALVTFANRVLAR